MNNYSGIVANGDGMPCMPCSVAEDCRLYAENGAEFSRRAIRLVKMCYNMGMKITFYGAAQTTTGSMHLVEANGKRILLDCGLYQEIGRAHV